MPSVLCIMRLLVGPTPLQCVAPPNCAKVQDNDNPCNGCNRCQNRFSLVAATKTCSECTSNPNCVTFQSNACDCAPSGCKPGFDGPKCTPVS